MPELTGPQIITKKGYKAGKKPLTYDKIRLMRKHPTISLARKLFFAGIIVAEWQYEPANEDVPEERVQFIREQLEPMRRHILQKAALGCFDFGWQPFEKVFDVVNGKTVIKKLKPLIQDNTEINEDDDTGQFLGFKQGNQDIPLEQSLLYAWDVEGTEHKGESTLSNAEWPYDSAWILDDAATRFDKKMAGAHWVITFPDGVTNFNGQEIPNHEAAQKVLEDLQSSGHIALCAGSDIARDLEDEQSGWSIKLISAQGVAFPFADRFSYLDTLMVRALGFPERAILEGHYGTKAESEAQGDFTIVLIEDRHLSICETTNWHLVNQLLRFEFGPEAENTVVIKPAPLNDANKAILKAVYDKILSNPDAMIIERESLDIQAICDMLGIPRNEMSDLPTPTLPNPNDLPSDPNINPDAPAATQKITPAQEALNGSQITSLIELVTLVRANQLDRNSALIVAQIAFQGVDPATLSKLFTGIQLGPTADSPAPTGGAPATNPAPTQPIGQP